MNPVITSTPENINIMLVDDGYLSRGTASANLHPLKDHAARCWWISRVLISREENRGHGWGGMLLDTLIVEIIKQDGAAIIVTPGGYGADPKKQIAFYEAHDFFKVGEGVEAHWVWTRGEETARNLAVRAAQALVRAEARAQATLEPAGQEPPESL